MTDLPRDPDCTCGWHPEWGRIWCEHCLRSTTQQAWALAAGDEPDTDGAPHAGCYQPHTSPDGYTDCDGQPL